MDINLLLLEIAESQKENKQITNPNILLLFKSISREYSMEIGSDEFLKLVIELLQQAKDVQNSVIKFKQLK